MHYVKRTPKPPFLARLCGYLVSMLALTGLSAAFAQTTYYVAANGNDANNGRSDGAAFLTLSKVSSLTLQPGDQVLFRRGDTFRGTLQIRQSGSGGNPIVVDAYGSGSKPVLAGSALVTGWTATGGNVWQATCSACGSRVTGLYRDGTALPLGRYPNLSDANKGYLTVQSHAGKNSLTSQQSLPANFSGGEVVYRPVQWILNRAPITGQSGNTLSLSNSNNYDIADGWGFFVQNHPATLDQSGEWSYEAGSKTLRLYDMGNPNGQSLAATAFSEALNLNNASNVTVRNLTLTQALSSNLLANGGSNLIIADNDILNAGENGVYLDGAGNTVVVENNRFEDINNNGFTVQPYQNVTFRGNTVRRIGLAAGRGKSGDGTYVAVQALSTSNTLIENNVVEQVGYIGISFTTSTTVRFNRVSDFCRVKSDGGGIYTWNGTRSNFSNMRVESNIVFNGVGAPEGTPGGNYSGANGIFLDDCSQNVEVLNNTTFGSKGMGIFFRAASNITLRGNTSFNNDELQFKMGYNSACPVRNNVTEDNFFVSRLASQPVVAYETNGNDLGSYGQFDRNVYARPFEDIFKIRAVYNPGTGLTGTDLSLAQWQSQYGKDPNSQNSPLTFKSYTLTGTGPTPLNQAFSANAENWDTWSPYGNGRATWDNGNRLDGGSLQLAFASSSGKSDSYLLATNVIGAVTAGKTYLLKFDAIASATGKRVEGFLRQRTGSYRTLSERSAVLVGTSRQSIEMLFTANADEVSSILVFQIPEDGKTVWIDNLRLQEVTRSDVNPDDYIKLIYNATNQPSQVSLDGMYRDLRNGVRQGQVTLAPFSSLILLKDEAIVPPPPPPPPPPVSLRDPENPANAVAGLDYGYYEGNWSTLPNFDNLTPVKIGTVGGTDLSVRNRNDQFGVRFKGYVNIPADGTYTFYTASDDGSKLYIGATEVVSNDGLHGLIEKSGTIGLKAGKHALSVLFFEGGGGESLSVSYSGPGLGKQAIPAPAYFRVSTGTPPPPPPPTGTGTGLRAEYFNNTTLGGSPVLTRVDPTVNFDWGTGSPSAGVVNVDNYSVRWSGQVEAPVSGSYTFATTTDDGVRLWVNGQQLINDWNGHPPKTNTGPALTLTAGQKYDIRMEYFEGSGGAVARLLWAYPGQSQQAIPKERLYPPGGSARLAATEDVEEPAGALTVYPVPARDELRLRFFAPERGEVSVQLFNAAAQPLKDLTQAVAPGENGIRLSVRELPRGFYLLVLTQGNQRVTRKVLLAE